MILAAEAQLQWHAHPDVWLLLIGALVAYVYAIAKLGPRHAPAGEEPATKKQKLTFLAGIAIMWIGADAPIHDLAEDFLFSAHMIQHTLFSLVAPPLLLLGMPRWLLRLMFGGPVMMRIMRVLTRPLVALIVFNLVIAVTHWPALVNFSVQSEPGHFALHSLLVSSALLMWWPVVGRLPELGRLSDPGKMLYLFGQSILPTVPASFLTFADTPIYSSYASFPRLWGISATTDQMVAGLLMKIGGGLLLWSIIAVIFFKWYARENAEPSETVTWHDFEHELNAWDLRRS
jgi:putative membrane protein